MPANVKQTMIERTAVLLAKKGLQGASFSEILEASGAPRGSLSHHFPGGKHRAEVLAALEHAGNQALGVLDRLSGKPAREIAEGFLSLWRSVLARSDFSAGCAVVAVTVAADSEELRLRAADILRGWREKLVALFAESGIPKKKARALSASLVAACEGAVILARAERAFEPFDLVAAEQLGMVEAAARSASGDAARRFIAVAWAGLRKSAIASRKTRGFCNCGTCAQPARTSSRASGNSAASSCDIGGGVASSCSPTRTRTGTLTFGSSGRRSSAAS